MLDKISSLTAASIVAITFVVAGEAQAAIFSQTQTAIEAGASEFATLEPLFLIFPT